MPHDGEAVVSLTVANEGAAPFYWDWAANLYLESADGTTLSTVQLPLSLPKLMPGETQTVEVVLKEVMGALIASQGAPDDWHCRSHDRP